MTGGNFIDGYKKHHGIYRYCFRRGSFGNYSRKIYHLFDAEKGGPSCKVII
ncbi:hypothetical protein LCGC14_3039610, partial [marine sediment metagenome]